MHGDKRSGYKRALNQLSQPDPQFIKINNNIQNINTDFSRCIGIAEQLSQIMCKTHNANKIRKYKDIINECAKNHGVIFFGADDEIVQMAPVVSFSSLQKYVENIRNHFKASSYNLVLGDSNELDNVNFIYKYFTNHNWFPGKSEEYIKDQIMNHKTISKLIEDKYNGSSFPWREENENEDMKQLRLTNQYMKYLMAHKSYGSTFSNQPLEEFSGYSISKTELFNWNNKLLPGNGNNDYKEYDATFFINKKARRDSERFVVKSDRSHVYYTAHHYAVFFKLK